MKRLALAAISSCAMFSTETYTATRDMSLNVTIDSSSARTHVAATLIGPFGRVDLGPNDSLSLAVDGAPIVSSGATSFERDVPERSGDFAFSLHHEGDHDATAEVTLVPPSNIRATSAAGKLVLDWTAFPNAGDVTITVAGSCITTQTIHVHTDTGHYELFAAQMQTLPAPCALSLSFTRELDAQVPFLGETFMYATVTQAETAEGQWTP